MYQDNQEALRARVDTLEAELTAAERGREAAEAEASAARLHLRESELAARHAAAREGQPLHEGAYSPGMQPNFRLAWPVLMLTILGAVSTLYLGRSWSQQWRVTRQVHLQNLRLRHEISARHSMYLKCRAALTGPSQGAAAATRVPLVGVHHDAMLPSHLTSHLGHSKSLSAKWVSARGSIIKHATEPAAAVPLVLPAPPSSEFTCNMPLRLVTQATLTR